MNQKNLPSIWLCILSIIAVAYGTDPLYTISAPNVLRPGSPYQLVVTVHQAPAPVVVHATLTPKGDRNDTLPLQADTTVNNGETKLLEMQVGSNVANSYEFNVVGSGGIVFNKTSYVNSRSKTFSIFIQTDKAIYKPGQPVHFRVIATDSLLKPYNTNSADIYIFDSQGNRIKQWRNTTLTNGIFTGELQLSDQVLLGDWNIRVEIRHQGQSSESMEMETKSFTIEEYVLPTFEVEIDLPSIVTYNQSDMVATVHAKYTYGKPVKGDVTLNVSDYYCQYPCISHGTKPFTVKTSIDGKAEVKLNLVQDLALPEWYRYGHRRFIFIASVTEALTGRQQNGTKDMTLYEHRHKLEFVQTSTFKPGLKYTATLKVTMQDGSPVIDDHNNVSVSYNYNWNDERTSTSFPVPRDGIINVELLPPETADTIRFEANYLGASSYSTASRAQSLSERYLQITLQTEKPKVGDEVELLVDATKELNDALVIQVVGRGKILHVDNIPGSKITSQVFKFKLTPEMAPKVRVIVYYTTPCGEVVADALDFGVEGVFKTPVSLAVSPNSTEPGSPVKVNVVTHPHAYVGLLAVDQSVLLLKSGNDLSTEQVLNDLQGYEIGYISSYSFGGGSYMRPWRPTSTTTMQLFSNVGLIFLTNGLLARIPQPHYGGYGGGYGGDELYALDDGEYYEEEFGPPPPPLMRGALPRPASFAAPQNFMTTSANRQEVAMKVGGTSLMEPSRVRRYFPETFLWTNVTADNDGKVQLNVDAPDTITSYVINAFAMDKENGLGLAESPAKMQIFRSFFVTLNLPYSIVRGETVALQALVFNYLKEEVEAVVTLDNQENNFDLVDLENEVSLPEEHKEVTKKVKVAPGQGASVLFVVTPKKLGYVDLKVTAKSTVAADALIKKLLVKAEGTPVYFNKGFLIDLRNESKFESSVDIEIPDDHVAESERVEISAIGDIMGTTVNNLDKLLRMPYGCGEQNMVNFVPNIAITEYLSNTGQLTEEIKAKAIKYMESGYQRELTYKRTDFSFSAFGKSDKNGSTWLTAFVVKSFIQARPYIPVEDNSIVQSLRWLASLQAANGSFPEVGSVFNKAMQGGSGKGLALTAYVLSTFLESKASGVGNDVPPGVSQFGENTQNNLHLSAVISSAVALLEKELPKLNSTYDLVLTTYVLHLADSKEKDAAFAKMNQAAHTENDVKYWNQPLPEANASDPWSYYNRPRSVDVEMTAYGLLIYSLRNQLTDAIPIMRWLISKRNENGGFESTQDTVLGIQALAKFGEKLAATKGASVAVSFNYENGKKDLQLNKDNALILHREQLPRTVRNVQLTATGNGVGIVQVTWSYNVVSTKKAPAFEVHSNATEINNDLKVDSCVKYTYGDGESNMAVMEIGFPSGYVADREALPAISDETKIKRVDTKDGDTVVVVYFDKIGKEVCTSASAHRTTKVAQMKPAHIEVYDYYDTAKRGELFYDAPTVAVCDLCESEECKQKCKK